MGTTCVLEPWTSTLLDEIDSSVICLVSHSLSGLGLLCVFEFKFQSSNGPRLCLYSSTVTFGKDLSRYSYMAPRVHSLIDQDYGTRSEVGANKKESLQVNKLMFQFYDHKKLIFSKHFEQLKFKSFHSNTSQIIITSKNFIWVIT